MGDLTPIQRERIQPQGGRLDVLLADDNGTRYEVELQLGATDPSHIIRTIEYWDTERKRYPQYDHCAVIIAEEITSRFMNVISLFNGSIPLIAIQVSACKVGNDTLLTFTKVMDRISLGTDEEENFEITDRNYWENKSTTKILKTIDNIFDSLSQYVSGYELKYNKFYIGLSKDGIAKNFIEFKPKKNWLYFIFKGDEDTNKIEELEKAGLEVSYIPRWKEYDVRINNFEEFKKHQELLKKMVESSMQYFNLC